MICDISLLQILKWEPDYFKSVKELPKEMPEDLKKHIEGMQNKGLKFVSLNPKLSYCHV
jgi:hypothetical protein